MKIYAVLNNKGKEIIRQHPEFFYLFIDTDTLCEVSSVYLDEETGKELISFKREDIWGPYGMYAYQVDLFTFQDDKPSEEEMEMFRMLGWRFEDE